MVVSLKAVIPLALVISSYPTRAHGIIVNIIPQTLVTPQGQVFFDTYVQTLKPALSSEQPPLFEQKSPVQSVTHKKATMIEKQKANVLSSRKEKEACNSFNRAVSEMDKYCHKPFHGKIRYLIGTGNTTQSTVCVGKPEFLCQTVVQHLKS